MLSDEYLMYLGSILREKFKLKNIPKFKKNKLKINRMGKNVGNESGFL